MKEYNIEIQRNMRVTVKVTAESQEQAEKVGFLWLHEPETLCLEGKKDSGYQFGADSAGKRMLFWAAIHQHTVEDLYSMAA